MARRRRPTPALYGALRLLPWWISLLAAAASYLGLSHLAQLDVIPLGWLSPDLDQQPLLQLPLRMAVGIGQWAVPLFLVLAGVDAGIRDYRRRRLFLKARKAEDFARAIAVMHWRDFEHLVAEAFRRQGFTVESTAAGADGGVDVRMHRGGQRSLVQCKRYTRKKVPVQTARELFGVMAAEGADAGYLVASSGFTREALSFAQGQPTLHLLDGSQLKNMISGIEGAPAGTAQQQAREVRPHEH